jgi:hypothetical protein
MQIKRELKEYRQRKKIVFQTNIANILHNYIVTQSKGKKRGVFKKYSQQYNIPQRAMTLLINETPSEIMSIYYLLKITTSNFTDDKAICNVIRNVFSNDLIQKLDCQEIKKQHLKVKTNQN